MTWRSLESADWLGTGTIAQQIEVFNDTTDSIPWNQRDFQLPANSIYFQWKLSGNKIIRITKSDRIPGNKAMVSGIFFDP